MRYVLGGLAMLAMSGCVYSHLPVPRPYPYPDGGSPQQGSRFDPYHRDKIPDTPYEIRKAEMEQADRDAGRGGPTYPPLFKSQKDESKDGDT